MHKLETLIKILNKEINRLNNKILASDNMLKIETIEDFFALKVEDINKEKLLKL